MFFRIHWFSYGLWPGGHISGELKLIKWLKKDWNILPNAETRCFGSTILCFKFSTFPLWWKDSSAVTSWQDSFLLWSLSSPAATSSWSSLEQSFSFFGFAFSPETWLEEFGKIVTSGLLSKRNVVSDSLKWFDLVFGFFSPRIHMKPKTPKVKRHSATFFQLYQEN